MGYYCRIAVTGRLVRKATAMGTVQEVSTKEDNPEASAAEWLVKEAATTKAFVTKAPEASRMSQSRYPAPGLLPRMRAPRGLPRPAQGTFRKVSTRAVATKAFSPVPLQQESSARGMPELRGPRRPQRCSARRRCQRSPH